MDDKKIARAWKDPAYRASLTEEERAALPEHPAGDGEQPLDEKQQDEVSGGASRPSHMTSCGWVCTFTTECPSSWCGGGCSGDLQS